MHPVPGYMPGNGMPVQNQFQAPNSGVWTPGNQFQNQQPMIMNPGHNHYWEQQYQDLRALINMILGMPAPLEKAGPNCYADSPFVNQIAQVAVPKGFTAPTSDLV